MTQAIAAGLPEATATERALRRARVPDHVARLLVATPTFRWSWLGAAVAATACVVAAASVGERTMIPFVVVAPLLPLGGVALAYGPWADPMDDLARAAPTSGVHLLLLRATAVLAATTFLAGAAVVVVPPAEIPILAWALASLGLTLAMLALATVVRIRLAAAIVAGTWVVTAIGAEIRSAETGAAFRGAAQLAFAVLATGSAATLAWRHDRLEREGRERRRGLVDAAERERRRIERDLHDGAQQQLAALSVKLGVVKGLIDRDPTLAAALLDTLQAETRDALDALRDVTRATCPPLLADEGLGAALAEKAAGAPVPVQVRADAIGRLSIETEIAVYYCCCEALQNAVKHAEADHVAIVLRPSAGDLVFTVTDDGVGFDPMLARRGIGLRSLEERVVALGGTLDVRSAPGAGCTIEGRVPITRPDPVVTRSPSSLRSP